MSAIKSCNRIIVVTGVASGVGRFVAEQFIKSGEMVFGIDVRNVSIPGMTLYLCDIRDENCVKQVFEQIKIEVGYIDWIINCAGIICRKEIGYIKDLSISEWRDVIDVNLTGAFIIAKYAIPLLEKSSCGNIINFSSDKVHRPDIGTAPYAVSKAGIEMLGKNLAHELLQSHIRVNTIAMSSTRTNFIREYINDDSRFEEMMKDMDNKMPYGIIEPANVYETIKFVLSNSKIDGQVIMLDSGILLQ